MEKGHPIQRLFLPRIYAVIIPVIAGVLLLGVIGNCSFFYTPSTKTSIFWNRVRGPLNERSGKNYPYDSGSGFFLLLLNFKIEIPWLDEQPT